VGGLLELAPLTRFIKKIFFYGHSKITTLSSFKFQFATMSVTTADFSTYGIHVRAYYLEFQVIFSNFVLPFADFVSLSAILNFLRIKPNHLNPRKIK
jgi:hypothetical protein